MWFLQFDVIKKGGIKHKVETLQEAPMRKKNRIHGFKLVKFMSL